MIDLGSVGNIADFAPTQARERGKSALIQDGRRIIFAAIDERASRVAQWLLAEGVVRQERIAFLSKNSDHFFASALGVANAGGALASINFRLAALEIGYVVADSDGIRDSMRR